MRRVAVTAAEGQRILNELHNPERIGPEAWRGTHPERGTLEVRHENDGWVIMIDPEADEGRFI